MNKVFAAFLLMTIVLLTVGHLILIDISAPRNENFGLLILLATLVLIVIYRTNIIMQTDYEFVDFGLSIRYQFEI